MTTRRSVLVAGLLGAVSLAGCEQREDRTPSGGPVSPGGVETLAATESETTTPTTTVTDRTTTASPPTPGSTDTGEIRDVSLTSGDGACGSEAEATIGETTDGIVATGSVVAPTPCHLATLRGQSVAGATATFEIDVREDPEVEACVECIGAIPFELTATLPAAVDTVVLELRGTDPRTIRAELDQSDGD